MAKYSLEQIKQRLESDTVPTPRYGLDSWESGYWTGRENEAKEILEMFQNLKPSENIFGYWEQADVDDTSGITAWRCSSCKELTGRPTAWTDSLYASLRRCPKCGILMKKV